MKKYQPKNVESKWQEKWEKEGINKVQFSAEKKNYYDLVELPYPSGDLHLGHWFAFVPPDAFARFKRMQGYNVFFPMGFDAFGLPAENAAIKRGVHPKDWTFSNIKTMEKQFQSMGTMLAWDHEVITCEPKYYRWNQWIFIKMFEKGLAYRGKALSNWCPIDQTVLANENIENGKCWRCGSEVVQKEIEQWFLKITEYAERLIWKDESGGPERSRGTDSVDWPNSVRVGQNNWIGKKEGMKIKHKVIGMDLDFETFTAFPAWSWADTFVVIAPEHPLVKELIKGTEHEKSVQEFIQETSKLTNDQRIEEKFEKKGIFTGRFAKDPFGGPDMPIWLANFALMNFGTGIIRCSGHDPRDVEFANKYKIPLKEVVDREDPSQPVNAHTNKGILKDSGPFSGREVSEIIPEVMDWIEKEGIGKRHVNYHIHDWSISRQRYWGTPVPMIHCKKCGIVPVPEKDLPIELPYDVDFTPKGEPPLASNKEWLKTKCPKCGDDAKRDAETLDTFFDSSWYFFRYLDPDFDSGPFDENLAKEALPVDIYFGGAEHTLGHTLYARFFTKFFKDLGLIEFDEFSKKRVQHGVVLGPDGNRMSKSKGNVINPDELVKEYGADTVRLYLSFMMPYIETTAPFSPGAIAGIYRFLRRIWDLYDKTQETITKLQDEDLFMMNKTIKKVTDDLSEIKFNTSIAALMEWLNFLSPKEKISKEEYSNFILLLAPFAPHIAEELWEMMGNSESVHLQEWPAVNEKYLQEKTISIAVQVNGKVRDVLKVESEKIEDQSWIEQKALESEKVKKFLEGKEPKKIIYVPGKIVSIVIQ